MDGKGKPRGEVSDVAQQSGGRRIDGSLKGEDGRKKSVPANRAAPRFMWCCIITRPPPEMGKLEQCDACGLVPVCVCVCCICAPPRFCSPSSRRSFVLQSKLTSQFGRGHPAAVRRNHPRSRSAPLRRSLWKCRRREERLGPPRTRQPEPL